MAIQIPPVTSYLASLIVLETLNFTGKYIPINQLYIAEFFSIFPQNLKSLERKFNKTRLDNMIYYFGNKLVENLEKLKFFN